jgi:hypothetical protein
MREDITLAPALPAANELLGAYRTHFCGRPAVGCTHPVDTLPPYARKGELPLFPDPLSRIILFAPYDERDRVEHCQIAHFEGP